MGERAYLFGAIEKRLHQVYRPKPAAMKSLLKGAITLRSQKGLGDKFLEAMKQSTATASTHGKDL